MGNKAPKIAFLVLLAILLAAFCVIVRPFLLPALFALVIAVICNPIYNFLLKLVRQRHVAAFITTVFVCICILIPLGMAVAVIVLNAADAVHYVTSQLEAGQIATALDNANVWFAAKMSGFADILPENFSLRASLIDSLKEAGKVIYQYSPKVITATVSAVGGLLLLVILLFVFFAEGGRMYESILGLMPLKNEHKKLLAREVRTVISATFLGMIATSVAQGILIGIGFYFAGISNPVFWGLTAIGVTLIPIIGGPLMYIPAVTALAIGGETGKAAFLLLYGVLIVSLIDNLIKPLIMRGKVNINPVLLALSLIGGALWIGPAGIILGPLVVVLMIAMLRIYQREF